MSRYRMLPTSAVLLLVTTLFLLSACGMPGMVAKGSSLPTAVAVSPTVALPPLRLPQDEAPHNYLTEWWYYTGHLDATDASGNPHAYGFELTFFQVLRGIVPPIYIGHYAITDLNRQEFHYDQRLVTVPNAIIPNGTSTTGFNLAVNDWTMQGVNGHDHIVAGMMNYAIDLTLQANKAAALHNSNGLISYGPAGFSYYYSRTRMQVSGTIKDGDQTLNATGQAWMDHQWGNFITVGGTGWDWFSIQLANGTDYMLYVIRDPSGKLVSTFGTRTDAQGNSTEVDSAKIAINPTATWKSPGTGITYPSGWSVNLPEGTLAVTPQLQNQELVTTQSTGNTYWEGACQIQGTIDGQPMTGKGYTELTGYHL